MEKVTTKISKFALDHETEIKELRTRKRKLKKEYKDFEEEHSLAIMEADWAENKLFDMEEEIKDIEDKIKKLKKKSRRA